MGRIGPGQILLVDLEHKKIFRNGQLKKQVSHARKYRKWIRNNMLFLPRFKAEESGLAGPAEGRLLNYMRQVAQNVREILAQLGFQSLEEIVGRTDLLIPTGYKIDGRRGQFDLRPLMHQPDPEIRSSVRARRPARNLDPLALRMAEDVKQTVDQGISIVREYKIRSTNRTIGARASSAVALRYGNCGMKDHFAEFRFHGSAGRARERFAVRNSGATAVVDGTGDHACEYMTGGTVVILGEPGRNFGAGMTNGIAFVFDSAGRFEQRYNPELVKIERVIEPGNSHLLWQLVPAHAEKTGSTTGRNILENWSLSLLSFWKVEPRSKPAAASNEPVPLSSNEPAKV